MLNMRYFSLNSQKSTSEVKLLYKSRYKICNLVTRCFICNFCAPTVIIIKFLFLGVNQKCIYDEHCIEGAYCHHQSACKCKDSSPYAFEDGLICSSTYDIRRNRTCHTLVEIKLKSTF